MGKYHPLVEPRSNGTQPASAAIVKLNGIPYLTTVTHLPLMFLHDCQKEAAGALDRIREKAVSGKLRQLLKLGQTTNDIRGMKVYLPDRREPIGEITNIRPSSDVLVPELLSA